jgi:hypothetical protein
MNIVHFIWEGPIAKRRLELLKACCESTSAYNPTHQILLWSNTIQNAEFDPLYNIEVRKWDITEFDNIPVSNDIIDRYIRADKRTFSDFFRLVLLYRYGGCAVDTDDACIGPITDTKNVICRSYDGHTAFYNKIKDEDCMSGTLREIRGYDDIAFFPRNDCLMNFDPQSPFIHRLFTHPSFVNSQHPLNILGGTSFQSMIQTVAKEDLTPCVFGLTLLYFYEGFCATSCSWDYKEGRGEMHDLYNDQFPDLDQFEWGKYKCNKHVARSFMFEALKRYPHLSHIWMHDKEANDEWFQSLEADHCYAPSTWIYEYTKEYSKLLI